MYQQKKAFARLLYGLLYLFPLLIPLCPGASSLAYYQIEHNDSPGLLSCEPPDHSNKHAPELGLYVSISRHGDSAQVTWDFRPTTSFRIPLDVIDCNPPVVLGLTRRSTSLEVSLQTLLYADIKLKKLLAEYARIQERARKLLGNEAGNQVHGDNADALQRSGTGGVGGASLQSELRRLEAKKRHASRRILQARSQEAEAKALQALLSGSIASLEQRAKRSSQSLQEMVDAILAHGRSIAAEPVSEETASLDVQKTIDLHDHTQQSELPWLLQKLLGLLRYVLSHKLEAGIYLLSFGVLLGIALSIRR